MIITQNNKTEMYMLLTDDGFSIKESKNYDDVWAYAAKHFPQCMNCGMVTEDFSDLYQEDNRSYITKNQLIDECLNTDSHLSISEYIESRLIENGGNIKKI